MFLDVTIMPTYIAGGHVGAVVHAGRAVVGAREDFAPRTRDRQEVELVAASHGAVLAQGHEINVVRVA